jgi:hypothetical protein
MESLDIRPGYWAAPVNIIGDDLHGPGSGVKWFNFMDPDGNLLHLEQA